MTASNWQKMMTQLGHKPIKKAKLIKFNKPADRSCGVALRKCNNCGRVRARVNKYGLNLCRQCFRDFATELGFKKYS